MAVLAEASLGADRRLGVRREIRPTKDLADADAVPHGTLHALLVDARRPLAGKRRGEPEHRAAHRIVLRSQRSRRHAGHRRRRLGFDYAEEVRVFEFVCDSN